PRSLFMGQPEQRGAMPPGDRPPRQPVWGSELWLELRQRRRRRPELDEFPGPSPEHALAVDHPLRHRLRPGAVLDPQCAVTLPVGGTSRSRPMRARSVAGGPLTPDVRARRAARGPRWGQRAARWWRSRRSPTFARMALSWARRA